MKKTKINKEEKIEKIKIPKTKSQKLKLKHNNMLIIISVLLVIVLVILLLPSKKEEKVVSKPTQQKVVKDYKIKIYDQNSKLRPYAVMIPNDSGAKKRQYGIQNAYLTYEITVEGGITRLLALFKDVEVEKIGPVRSSRHYYLDYALENDAIYVHFGWSPQAEIDIPALGINNLNGLYNPSNMFWRDKNYSSPNNAFTSTANIRTALVEKSYRETSDNYEVFKYEEEVDVSKDKSVRNANNVVVNYSGSSYVKYVYDSKNKYYMRFNNKNEHIDNLSGEQVHVKNIIVLKADTVDISGDDKGRQNFNNIGTGEGIYISNGKAINILWKKDSRESKTIYTDLSGNDLILNDGNTFIQIQPSDKNTVIE